MASQARYRRQSRLPLARPKFPVRPIAVLRRAGGGLCRTNPTPALILLRAAAFALTLHASRVSSLQITLNARAILFEVSVTLRGRTEIE